MTNLELYEALGEALKNNPSLESDEARFLPDWTLFEDEDGLSSDAVDNNGEIIDNIEYTMEGTMVFTS